LKNITLITNTDILDIEGTIKLSIKLSRLGLKRIQIREKKLDRNDLIYFIKKMKDSIEENCEIFLNGNIDLAIDHNINGVHFSENTLITKKIISEKRILFGRSLHQNTKILNPNNIFSYFHAGPVFSTLTHPGKPTITNEKIINLTNNLDKIIFVGGINTNNAHKLLKYNFDGIAVMRELLLSKKPGSTFLNLEEIINGKK
tara:strand:- start:187 stop:789 length:603 start_codon:yes stop_codon:yes gene_type:complete